MMSIKLVCTTRVNGELISRPILDKSTTPSNIITVADRFLALHRELAALNGDGFVSLNCEVDGKSVDMRALIESVSTAFFLLRKRVYGSNGFSLLKQEVEAEAFLKWVHTLRQPLPAPKWTGMYAPAPLAPKNSKVVPSPNAPLQEDDKALMKAISVQTAIAVEEPVEPPPEEKKPRRMNASNFKI